MVKIRDLHHLSDENLNRVTAIYRDAFLPEEQVPFEAIRSAARNEAGRGEKRYHAWSALLDGKAAGLAFFSYCRKTNMGFLGYLAVDTAYRGDGIGSVLFQAVVTQIETDGLELGGKPGAGLCFEVEPIREGLSTAEAAKRTRRIRFYRKNGASIVHHINYVAPPVLGGTRPIPYYLMYRPVNPAQAIDFSNSRLLKAILDTTLLHAYERSEDDLYYLQALASIQQK